LGADKEAFPRGRWNSLGLLLEKDLLILPARIREARLAEWRAIDRDERGLDDRIALGLVGGTGVGKSTLINALASAEISRRGEIRPTTARVVAYRHEETPLPEALPRGDLAEPEAVHSRPSLLRVIILDFPDFDSVESAHREILERHLAHLDLILVLVDDMKYGDLRLFEVMASLRQSPENIHVALNKIDRLSTRYPGRSEEVVESILADLRSKLAEHSQLEIPRERAFAISASRAFESTRTESGRRSEGVGEFPRLQSLLEDYRTETRRRAAKILNLEARKAALVSSLREEALRAADLAEVERARAFLSERRSGLRELARAIPARILSARERGELARECLGRGSARLGFPLSLFWSLGAEVRGIGTGGSEAPRSGLSAERVGEHYRSYLDGIRNAEAELRLRFAQDSAVAAGAASPSVGLDLEVAASRAALTLGSRMAVLGAEWEKPLGWRAHLPAVLVAAFSLWWLAHPVVRELLGALAGTEGRSWTGVGRESLAALLGVLHPLWILGSALFVVLAYAATALWIRLRRRERLDRIFVEEEDALRDAVRVEGEARLDAATGRISRWLEERAALESSLSAADQLSTADH
jgi:GTP-binding protein EngB required for normal cell division